MPGSTCPVRAVQDLPYRENPTQETCVLWIMQIVPLPPTRKHELDHAGPIDPLDHTMQIIQSIQYREYICLHNV